MPSDPPENESEADRLNRNFDDLLQELRVSQNGTQILFAFLLTVPFSTRFGRVTDSQRAIYFVALLLSALSAMLLIAPAVMHRVLFRRHHKKELVETASGVALGGQTLLALAVAASVLLVTDYLYNEILAAFMSFIVLAWTTAWFFVVPLWIRRRHDHSIDDTTSST
jgi:hypothetical protein